MKIRLWNTCASSESTAYPVVLQYAVQVMFIVWSFVFDMLMYGKLTMNDRGNIAGVPWSRILLLYRCGVLVLLRRIPSTHWV